MSLPQRYKHSEETKRKIGLANKGRKPSPLAIVNSVKKRRGRHISEEQKKKISDKLKGKKLSEEHIERISKSKLGHSVSIEARKNMSRAQKKNPNRYWLGRKNPYAAGAIKKINKIYKREKHWNWRGGITPENNKIRSSIELRLWRESIFARDGWTCQKYNTMGGKLIAHHIQNFSQYPELRLAINNGITLSEKAHREFHRKYGIKNNTKEQLQEFLCLQIIIN